MILKVSIKYSDIEFTNSLRHECIAIDGSCLRVTDCLLRLVGMVSGRWCWRVCYNFQNHLTYRQQSWGRGTSFSRDFKKWSDICSQKKARVPDMPLT